jgi:Fe-S-cluster containining protein
VQAEQGKWLVCNRGCDGCCRTRRTAWRVELDHIEKHLAQRPSTLIETLQIRREHPDVLEGQRCIFLSDEGHCDIYEARPVICRTHGPVVRIDAQELTWCELNFDSPEGLEMISSLREDSILNLELLNGMLALINRQFCQQETKLERAPLETTLDRES